MPIIAGITPRDTDNGTSVAATNPMASTAPRPWWPAAWPWRPRSWPSEPRTSRPAARLRTITELATAGVPTIALVAPVIPGLTDSELPAILAAAKAAGAVAAGWQLLRLPASVQPIFCDWLSRTMPDAQPRIEARIRDTRAGELSDCRFGHRMRGQGEVARQIAQVFRIFAGRHGLAGPLPALTTTDFRPPVPSNGQQWLF